jgi:hypothetical protein
MHGFAWRSNLIQPTSLLIWHFILEETPVFLEEEKPGGCSLKLLGSVSQSILIFIFSLSVG